MKRRRKALEWGVEDYLATLQRALDENASRGTLETMYGPWIPSGRQASAHSLVRNLPLVEQFVAAGQRSCVLHGARLEASVVKLLPGAPYLLGAGDCSRSVAHLFTKHLLTIMRAVGDIEAEERLPGQNEAASGRSAAVVSLGFPPFLVLIFSSFL